MRIIIHDLDNFDDTCFKDDYVVAANMCKNHCVGCFSCWVKSPKVCQINDNYNNLPSKLLYSDELIIISKNRYGCYSSSIKCVLERCIGYVLPYFRVVNGEIHHKTRLNKKLKFKVIFYGEIDDNSKKCITGLIEANSKNLDTYPPKITFVNDKEEAKKCIL